MVTIIGGSKMRKSKLSAACSIMLVIAFVVALLGSNNFMIKGYAVATAVTQTGGTEGIWVYTLSNGTATNAYCKTTTITGEFTIPSALDGYTVVSVGGGSSTNEANYSTTARANITSVIIPSGYQ